MKGNPKIKILLFILTWMLSLSVLKSENIVFSLKDGEMKTVKAAEEGMNLDEFSEADESFSGDSSENSSENLDESLSENSSESLSEDISENLSDAAEDTGENIEQTEKEDFSEITLKPSYEEDTDSTVYSCIYFGAYPQTQITGDRLTSEIINANYNENNDAFVHGNKYHKVENIYGISYFLYEPIKWKVISNPDGYIVAMAERGLDYYSYYDAKKSGEDSATDVEELTDEELENYKERRSSYGVSNWEESTIRSWLNSYGKKKNIAKKSYKGDGKGFLNRAFSDEEQEDMREIDEFQYMKFSQNLSNGKGDKVMLLNLQGVLTARYGFTNTEAAATGRILERTDYAIERGRALNDDFSNEGAWWIASNSKEENVVHYISSKGAIKLEGTDSYHSMLARPVIVLNEDSEYIKDAGKLAVSNGSGDCISLQLKADSHVFLNEQKNAYKDATVEILVKNIGSEPVQMVDAILEFEDGSEILDGENKIHFSNIEPQEEKNIAWKFAIKPQTEAKTAKYTVKISGMNLAQTYLENEISIPKAHTQTQNSDIGEASTKQEKKTFIEKLRDFFKGLA